MFSLFTFLITISVVVVFHEWGHYIAARYYGVRVERFSLGFGKVLLKRTDKRGTEWAISMWPLGGYVMPLAEPALLIPIIKWVNQSLKKALGRGLLSMQLALHLVFYWAFLFILALTG